MKSPTPFLWLLPRFSLLILAVVIFMASGGLARAERESLRLLAIGNSFSDDATAFLPGLARAGGKTLVLGRASIGGCSLERHARHLKQAQTGDEAGRAYHGFIDPQTGEKRSVTLVEAISATAWDFVTIQQWSQLSFKPETFQPFADELVTAIRQLAPRAEIVVHETWAYREDHPFFQKGDGFTPATMYAGVSATYKNFADGLGFRVLPVGDALHLARQTPRWSYTPDANFDFKNPPVGQLPDQRTSLNIGWKWGKHPTTGEPAFTLDAIHCNTAGRYLGACVWYLQLFEADALPTSYVPDGLSAEDAADLRRHALAAVQAERARAAKPVAAREE